MQGDLNNDLFAAATALQRRRGSPKGSSTLLCSLHLSAGEAAFISAIAQEPHRLLRWCCESVPPHLPGHTLCQESQQMGGRTFATATT